MNEILKVNYDNEQPTVSARELHEKLNIGTQYTKWFERMTGYGFLENVDFQAISQKRLTAQGNETTYTDHDISIDMAKQICMIQRSPEGKKIRQYFLDLEKAWNTPEQVMARALKLADKEIDRLKADNKVLLEDTARMKPKEIFADAVSASHTTILIGELAKLLRQNGIDIGAKRLFAWMRDNGYLVKRQGTDYNTPTQKSVDLGVLTTKETTVLHSDGSTKIVKTAKVTGKGQQYFINKFLKAAS